MMRQIKILSKLELINFFSLNEIRHNKDEKTKKTHILLTVTIGFLLIMAMSYVAGLSYGLIKIGAKEIVPIYIVFLSSLFTLLFCAFKAGKIIFKESCYDILSSMPIKKSAIVISRYIRLYVEGAAVAFVVMIPGIVVYSCMAKPGILDVFLGLLSVAVVPVIPVALSVLFGVIITGISSRMKNKVLFETVFVIAIVVGILVFGYAMSYNQNVSFDMEMLSNIAKDLEDMICSIYPPTAWFASALATGGKIGFLIGVLVSTVLFILVVVVTTINFEGISRRLRINIAKHDYKIGNLESRSMMKAIVYKEAKRYFSSGTYVVNTIIGPVLAVAFAVSMLFVEFESVLGNFPIAININGVVPVVFAGILTMCNPIATSISMEGKEFWIIKTLPISHKDILKGKLIFCGIFLVPFYVVGEVMMIIALKPSLVNFVWMIVIPIVTMACMLVIGIAVNLRFPKLKWNSDVEVVKQSASAAIGGFMGILLTLISAMPIMIIPEKFYSFAACSLCVVLIIITALVYKKNNNFDLRHI